MSEELKNSPIEDFDWDAFEKGEMHLLTRLRIKM